MSPKEEIMLINATFPEEVRVAIIDDKHRLIDLDIENFKRREPKKSNLYLGTITRVEASLRAVFVQYGEDRQGFLPLKEIDPKYFIANKGANFQESDLETRNIRELVREGQKVLVQIDKEPRGTKGAALTTYISLAGRYLVLMPNSPRTGGISRRVSGDERDVLRNILSSLNMPESMGVIVRTAGVGRSLEDLQYDLDELLQLWNAIKIEADKNTAPCLIHRESDIVIRTVRDYSLNRTREILIDDPAIYARIKKYVTFMHPELAHIVNFYDQPMPLFSKFNLENQIEEAFSNRVKLASGGSMVIDTTEALTSVDVNSAQSTKGVDIEETALHTNLEAAEAIARELRIRDIGGLVVIDFIDMVDPEHQRSVEDKLREATRNDRARIQMGRISKFGILEMSRQRLRPALSENTKISCPRCNGSGCIRTIESMALTVMRKIEEELASATNAAIQAFLPIDIAAFLANEKRVDLTKLEEKHNTKIFIIPDQHIESPNFVVKKVDYNSDSAMSNHSYDLIPDAPTPETRAILGDKIVEPLVQYNPSSQQRKVTNTGLLKRIWHYLFIPEQTNESINNNRSHHNKQKYADYSINKLHREREARDYDDDNTPSAILKNVTIEMTTAAATGHTPNIQKSRVNNPNNKKYNKENNVNKNRSRNINKPQPIKKIYNNQPIKPVKNISENSSTPEEKVVNINTAQNHVQNQPQNHQPNKPIIAEEQPPIEPIIDAIVDEPNGNLLSEDPAKHQSNLADPKAAATPNKHKKVYRKMYRHKHKRKLPDNPTNTGSAGNAGNVSSTGENT